MTDPGDDIAARAEQLAAEAAALPSIEQVAALAAQAVAHGGTPHMSTDEIRQLAVQAVEQAEQVAALLRRLKDLVAPQSPGGEEL